MGCNITKLGFSFSRSNTLMDNLIPDPTENPIQDRRDKASEDGNSATAVRRNSAPQALLKQMSGSFDGELLARENDAYDVCLVLNADKAGTGLKDRWIFDHLAAIGFDMYMYKGQDPTEIFILMRVDSDILKDYADFIKFKMKLDEQQLQHILATAFSKPILINDDPKYCKYKPCEHIYAPYVRRPEVPESLYWRPLNEKSPFRTMVRLALIGTLIDHGSIDGKALKLERRIRQGSIKAYFPLHDHYEAERLKKQWFNFRKRIWLQDLFPLKEYFGEKIGLYFRFVQHYTHWLLILAVIGVPLQLYEFIVNDYSIPFLPIYSFMVAIWNVMMLEHWKRSQKRQALEWGSVGFEATETDRAEFNPGESIRSYIDGTEGYKYFNPATKSKYQNQSNILVTIMILLAIGTVASIYVLRTELILHMGDEAGIVIGIINAIQINIYNYGYGLAAEALTNRENHRTETLYEDSLIGKFFAFQFVNSYSSFFYIAFVAAHMPRPENAPETDAGECGDVDCMKSLATNLATIFGTQIVVGNIVKYLIPYYQYVFATARDAKEFKGICSYLKYVFLYTFCRNKSRGGKVASGPEVEYKLTPYDSSGTSIRNYTTVAIQFGYMSLFISALPVAGVFAILCNTLNLRFELWSLLTIYQRPIPKRAEDIGTWQTVFTIIMVASVITNAGISVYTMDSISAVLPLETLLWVFILFQWACFTLQAILMALVPDIPEDVEIQLKRIDYIYSRVIERIDESPTDETSNFFNSSRKRTCAFKVHENLGMMMVSEIDSHRMSNISNRSGSTAYTNDGTGSIKLFGNIKPFGGTDTGKNDTSSTAAGRFLS